MKKHQIICFHPDETYKMVYWEWGKADNPKVLICVHGLTCNGRDFEHLAKELAQDYRVICPDIVGRGQSDWLSHAVNYNYTTYLQDILSLIQHLNLTKIDWLGTSMGGIIGMLMAVLPQSPIQRLILNDIGAFIPKESLQKIAKYLLIINRPLANLEEVDQHIRRNFVGFGQLSDQQWNHLAKNSVTLQPDGSYRLNCDPKIGHPFWHKKMEDLQDMSFWDTWQKISCPILLLHGVESNLLLPETIEKMQLQQPKMTVIHFDNTGHAPALMEIEQIQVIKQWLNS